MAIILTKDQSCDQRVQTVHNVTTPVVFTFSGSTRLWATVHYNGASVAILNSRTPQYIPHAVGDYTITIHGTCGTGNVYVDDVISSGGVSTVEACATFRGFDYFSVDMLDPNGSQSFEVLVDDNVMATIVENYAANDTGTKSSWYTHLVAAVNALPNWSMSIHTDVGSGNESEKPTWELRYSGPGNEKLEIRGIEGCESRYFEVDGSGTMTMSVNNCGTLMADFETPQFNQVACNGGSGGSTEYHSCMTFKGFDYLSINDLDQEGGQSFKVILNGLDEVNVFENYVDSDNGNKSSWYVNLVNAVNSYPHWTMSVNADVPSVTNERVIWNLRYDGPGNERLEIRSLDGCESRFFDVDGNGNITPSVDNCGSVMPDFETPQFNQVICNNGTNPGEQ